MEMQFEDFESNPPHQSTQVHDLINNRLAHIADVSIHSSPSSIKDALDVLDDEIDVLRDVLASVAARRNAISQISRLPPEILSRIFHFTADFHRAMDSKAHPNVGQSKAWAGWLEVLDVCRRWRAIALHDLSLWTELTYTTSLPRLGQILARVQGAPVKLHRYIRSNTKREFEVINDHLSHIKELMIVLDDKTAYFELCHSLTRASLSNPAPLLESVTFATRRPGEQLEMDDEELVTPLPETFFAGEVPALRRLALQSYLPQPLLSSPLITESITHFELTFPPTPLGETRGTENNRRVRFYLEEPSRAHLLSCLGRMPNLEVLQLVRCFPPPFASDSWPRDVTVHFLHLQRIMLKGSDTDCAGILERVTMPPSVSLSVTCLFRDHMPTEDLAALQPIISAIQAYTTSAASAHRITALAFQMSSYHPIRMHAWREQASGLEEDMPFLSVEFSAGNAVCLELLELLCGGPRLSDLRVLGLFSAEDAPMRWTGEYLAQLLADCDLTSVAHLVINSQTAALVPAAADAPGDFFGQLAAMSVLRGAVGFVSRHANAQVYIDQLIDPLVELKRRKGNLQTVYVQRRDVARWRTRVQGALSVRPLPANTRKYFRPFEIW